ncbi:hypothetical protein ABT288_28525 [Streptomyces sp. NPDC001093]|uniref:hypothetical protein n=1 Tax=Streptomyces sp. NPDC001093 TaxID=3154376 RepID=UPI00331AE210
MLDEPVTCPDERELAVRRVCVDNGQRFRVGMLGIPHLDHLASRTNTCAWQAGTGSYSASMLRA